MPFQLICSGFPEGGAIPKLYTCEGADVSPALEWSGAPEDTRSFALIVDDPDAPGGTWTHWTLYDIPATVRSLPQGYRPAGTVLTGRNDFGRPGYGGPRPPRGHGPHRYFFRLLAVDVETIGIPAGARRAEVGRALAGHTIAQAQYMGRYERR